MSLTHPETARPSAFPIEASGLRERLRAATAGAHARLDARLGALDLTEFGGYRRFLESMAAALLPIERALDAARAVDAFPDWPARARSDAILSDLRRIGGCAAALPYPVPRDIGETIGTVYVLEGSRLGGQALLRTVKQSADPRVTGATAFLTHGAGQHLWKSFLARLACAADDLDDDRSAIEGAQRAFALFERAASAA